MRKLIKKVMKKEVKNARSTQEIDAYVGHKLKQARLASGISQTALGAVAGISFQQLQKYEEGTNRVSIGRLYTFANTLDLPLDYFVDGFKPAGRHQKNPLRSRKLIDKMILDKKEMQLLQYYRHIDGKMRRHIYAIAQKIAETP